MPKNKKAKTSHAGGLNGVKAGADLTHDEIWDDSALLRSWEAAVEEYKYYHSLAAQGLDIETVLDEAEAAEANGEPLPLSLDGAGTTLVKAGPVKSDIEDGEIEDTDARPPTAEERAAALRRAGLEAAPSATESNPVVTDTLPNTQGLQQEPSQTAHSSAPKAGTEGAQREQTLENLKMAYYWAGYYSGLYDGQRQSGTKSAT